MTLPAMILLGVALCLLTSFFGPFGRKYHTVLYLALALAAEGAALSLGPMYKEWLELLAVLFLIGFGWAYVLQVRQSLERLRREAQAREVVLSAQMAEFRRQEAADQDAGHEKRDTIGDAP